MSKDSEVLEGFNLRGQGRDIELSVVFKPFRWSDVWSMLRGWRLQFEFRIHIDQQQVPRGTGARARLIPGKVVEEALR